ncbi:MAG TPA: methyltransferase domain-containing protein [Pyrinomonadaceae bacterium]|nr:methyltransferase domain-containing protein [Pyrinomonadaceae bacterium]
MSLRKTSRRRAARLGALPVLLLAVAICAPAGLSQKGARRNGSRPRRRPDVAFIPTPPETVEEMLRQARLTPGDVLYDLGSGDGRIPIRAAQAYGVRAVGIEIDPALVAGAQEAARRAGVADRVTFRAGDIYREDLRGATVVTLYLSDTINLSLRPKLLRELPAGARIVSHDFRMGDWRPDRTVRVPWRNLYRTVYVWTVPRK